VTTLAEKLGPAVYKLRVIGIEPHYPVALLIPKIFTIAPRLIKKLADAS